MLISGFILMVSKLSSGPETVGHGFLKVSGTIASVPVTGLSFPNPYIDRIENEQLHSLIFS